MIMHQDVITLGDGMMGGSFFFLWESLCFTTLLHEAYVFFGTGFIPHRILWKIT